MTTTAKRRPRGRPRKYDPDSALQAAMTTFWEQGFSATSLDDLSEATGMNRPSLYAAFGDKRAIFLRAMQRFADRMAADLTAALMQEPDLGKALQQFYYAAIDVYLSGAPGHRGCMVVTTASAETAADPEIQAHLARSIEGLDGLLSARFRRALKEGQDLRGDANQLGRLATAILHTLSVRARAGHSRPALRKLARESVALLEVPAA